MFLNKQIFIGIVLCGFCIIFVTGLDCWQCAADSQFGTICKDPFNETEAFQENILMECVVPKDLIHTVSPYCRKYQFNLDGQNVTSRSCVLIEIDKSITDCSKEPVGDYVKIVSCAICNTDGCNGSEMN